MLIELNNLIQAEKSWILTRRNPLLGNLAVEMKNVVFYGLCL